MLTQTGTHLTLLARVTDGADPGAWEEFCDRYGALIRGFARARGLQEADAEDVLQDVLLSLARSMPDFHYDPARGRFRSYLKTVVMHAISRRFGQDRARRVLQMESGSPPGAAVDAAEADWETEWRRYHLRLAMRTIDTEFGPENRAAFDLLVLQGVGAAEAAAAVGISLEQVYKAKSRILKRLEELVERQVREEG